MPTYIVRTVTYGDIRKQDDTIADARRWAKRAFDRGEVMNVRREYKNSFCDECQCAPCCCMVRRDV